jgi:hypothetical protein
VHLTSTRLSGGINVDELDRFEKIQNDVHINRLKLLEI